MYRPNAPASKSVSSVSSFQSFLSDDSYLDKMKPVDAGFVEMMEEIQALDTKRSILEERKLQSHTQKRRDQADINRRTDWSDKQIQDYAAYKALVKALGEANKTAAASGKAAKAQDDEASCKKALADQKARSDAAIRYIQNKNTYPEMTMYIGMTDINILLQRSRGSTWLHDQIPQRLQHPGP
jgi:hypothetical protein